MRVVQPVVLTAAVVAAAVASPSTVVFRKRVRGDIFALDPQQQTERQLAGTADASRLVSLALSPTRLYWSDHRSIRSAAAADGADVRADVGTLVRVTWTGVNLDDVLELSVLGTRCVSVIDASPTRVSCVVAVPTTDATPQNDDCLIRTRHGDMRGVAENRFEELRASGVPSPIVERLVMEITPVAPSALAVDGDDALFWANAVDGVIYRSSLRDTVIDVIQRGVWDVQGMALARWPNALELIYSLEGKGLLQRTRVALGSVSPPQTLVRGLRSPRGVALDPDQRLLYFTEKTGRLYRASLKTLQPLSLAINQSLLPDPELLVTVSSLSRLHGLAVDDAYVYWTESNSNVVARARVDTFEREVVVGGSADSVLSWPQDVAVASTVGASNAAHDGFYYIEYTGRVAKGKGLVLVNDLSVSTMKYLDHLIQQRDSPMQFYALE